MKKFWSCFVGVLVLMAGIFLVTNHLLLQENEDDGREYRVEIHRVCHTIETQGIDAVDISKYTYVTAVYQSEQAEADFFTSNSDYVIQKINGIWYRIEYRTGQTTNRKLILVVNLALAAMSVLVIAVFLFCWKKILAPFHQLKEVPYELSRGNLTVPIKESKNRLFGRFTWGVNLLRENIEQQKQRELELQREKKTLLLSISHDIKTPLSAIKLYAKALSKHLYTQEEKQTEIAEQINAKADEIESFVAQLIQASNEDFLQLEVHNGEFYLSELVREIRTYYTEKLALIQTDFTVQNYSNCLLKGDLDRSVEVLQNIMENAIKYGDGREIALEFREEDGCSLITIKNGGCTLPDTELVHMFDSFWRGSNAKNKSGSGLGLSICRKLMHQMHGSIFAEISGEDMLVTVVFEKG